MPAEHLWIMVVYLHVVRTEQANALSDFCLMQMILPLCRNVFQREQIIPPVPVNQALEYILYIHVLI